MVDGENVNKGTTVVAVKYKDFCVLAAERYVSMGGSRSGYMKKLRQINDNVVLGGAGGVGDIQWLMNCVEAENKFYSFKRGKELNAKNAAKILSNYSRGTYGIYVVAGRNSDGVETRLVDAAGGNMVFNDNIIAVGSGGENAKGVLQTGYQELLRKENVTKDDVVALAIRAISAAKDGNCYSGGLTDLYLIDWKDGIKEYSQEELQAIERPLTGGN